MLAGIIRDGIGSYSTRRAKLTPVQSQGFLCEQRVPSHASARMSGKSCNLSLRSNRAQR